MTEVIGQIAEQNDTNDAHTDPLDILVMTKLERVVIFNGRRPKDTVYLWMFEDVTFDTTGENPEHYCPGMFRCAYFDATRVDPEPPTEPHGEMGGWQRFIRRVIDARAEHVEVEQ